MDDITPTPSDETSDKAVGLFRELAARRKEHPTAPASYSRKAAVVLGAILGLAYGLCTQFINSLYAPSVPFSHHPFGLIGNVAASMAGMILICVVCSLPKDFSRGALAACATSLLVLELRALAIGSVPLTAQLILHFSPLALIGLVVELAVAFPAMLLLRWTLDIQSDVFDKPLWAWERIRLPLAFIAGTLILGSFSLYPADVLTAMANTTGIMDRGLAARSLDDLPVPLRNENNVQDFVYYGKAPYTVELGEYVTALDIKTGQPIYLIQVLVRFSGGWAVACVYENQLDDPVCKSFAPSDAPPVTDFRAEDVERPAAAVHPGDARLADCLGTSRHLRGAVLPAYAQGPRATV